jgi:hypothetical protein
VTISAASTPAAWAWRVSSIASAVEFEPVPAITGTRPSAASTQTSTMRLCSTWLTVGDSPVVPTGTNPSVPSSICHFTSLRNASSSKAPLANGVTRAVSEPVNNGPDMRDLT